MALYDRNNDGYLDAEELERCPALKGCLKELDKDGDGRLSEREIADRLATYRDSKIAVLSVRCRVTLDGEPLAGATVTFVPETFLGPAVQEAVGVTDEQGSAVMRRPNKKLDGMNCGLYRVEVSKKDGDGAETIPAKYNKLTTLGAEVGPDSQGPLVFALTTS
jgi:hypothetical protein